MRTARPLGLSPDGRTLIVVTDGGEELAIPADERLKAALRNDRARIGQLEIDMESALRPRDIQARIRSGESLEAVAQAAGVPIAKIEPFAGPVIAEREHIAGLAQTNPVRRAGDAVAHRSLRSVVSDRLLSHGVDIDDAEWDAWRNEDRRWTVRLSYELDSVEHQADFSYDQTGRFCTAANDDARWLTGEQPSSHGRLRHGDDPDAEPSLDLNDELAIVRAIQPQFAVTPDIEDDDLPDEPLDEDELDDEDEDDGSSDSEDAFTEGDLAEVDGVYDIVPGDRSNMDVLYDMLSSFDEDSVQIYAGLVRPRPEQSAAPVLDEGPLRAEIITEEIELEFDGGEPTERLTDDDDLTDDEDEEAEDTDLIEAELASDGPSPAALANAATDDDLVLTESERADRQPPEAGEAGAEAADEIVADEVVAGEVVAGEVVVETTEFVVETPEPVAETADEAESADEPAAESDPEPDAGAAAPESAEASRKARPGRVKPSPAEPEQPSLVDEAGNEPSRSIRRKRASVPSWDEIMFGAPRPEA